MIDVCRKGRDKVTTFCLIAQDSSEHHLLVVTDNEGRATVQIPNDMVQ